MVRPISVEGFEKPAVVSAGAAPALRWLLVADLVVDPSHRRQSAAKGERSVNRIARNFSWTCFAPVVVAPTEKGKFVIVDGQKRTTAAALAGFETVPCQIIIASREEQVVAFKTLNRDPKGSGSRMVSHAAALRDSDPLALRLADICSRAGVELLRYPVPIARQLPGQTMAIGAIAQCLGRYGEETLITALQCVTQTNNRRRGALSARMIKALCEVLDADPRRRDSGLALLEAFDAIDLIGLEDAATRHAAANNINSLPALVDQIQAELRRLFPNPPPNKADVTPQSRLQNALGLRARVPAWVKPSYR